MKRRFTCLLALLVCLASGAAHAKKEWEELKGGNFIIYYRNVPQDFVNTVQEEAENDLRRVTENLGITRYRSWAMDQRAAIYIYSDQDDYVKNGGQAGWSHGSALTLSKTIKTFPADAGFFDSLLPHELGHIILREIIGPYTAVPLWFEEGVAMYQEKARRLGAHQAVRKAIENGQFIPLTVLSDMRLYKDSDVETVNLFYMESASIVNFMLGELGQQRFYKFCEQMKEHASFEEALSRTYMRMKNIEDLNKQWVNFLEEQ